MPSMFLRPSGQVVKPYALQLRYQGSGGEIEFTDLCLVSVKIAYDIAAALGDQVWLFGPPAVDAHE